MALNDLHDGVFAQPKYLSDRSVGLPLGSEMQYPIGIPIGLDPNAKLPTEFHAPSFCGRNPGAHPFPQQITFELGQGSHQRREQLSLWRFQIELQPGLSDDRDPAGLQFLEAGQQIGGRSFPAGQFGDEHHFDLTVMRQRDDLCPFNPVCPVP